MINFNYSAKQSKDVSIAKLNNNGLKFFAINILFPFLLTYVCLTINHYKLTISTLSANLGTN